MTPATSPPKRIYRYPRKMKKVLTGIYAGGFPRKGSRAHLRLRRFCRLAIKAIEQ